jgi:hypothetical protein
MIREWYLDEPGSEPPAGESPRWIRAAAVGVGVTAVFCVGVVFGHQSVPDAPARIGKDAVPVGLSCQEDEAIALVGTSTPVCMNVGELAGRLGGDTVTVQGATYKVDDPNRPACFMEPSDTPEGVEMILYSRLADKTSDRGIEVVC